MMGRKIAWAGMTFLALMIAIYAGAALVTSAVRPPLFEIAGHGFDASYPLISWIAWVPNLLVVEWFILTRSPRSATSTIG